MFDGRGKLFNSTHEKYGIKTMGVEEFLKANPKYWDKLIKNHEKYKMNRFNLWVIISNFIELLIYKITHCCFN